LSRARLSRGQELFSDAHVPVVENRIREGLEGIAQAFGKQLAFESGAEVRAHLRSGRVLEF